MSPKLKKITCEEARSVIVDKNVLKLVVNRKEPVFIIKSRISQDKKEPLLEVEVALRKCERVGLFSK